MQKILYVEDDVEQNITFPLLLDYKKPDQKFVNELLQVLGLTERRNHLPSQLSGGQEVIALLQSMSQKYQQTILMITHNENQAGAADRVFRMSDGVLKDLGVALR